MVLRTALLLTTLAALLQANTSFAQQNLPDDLYQAPDLRFHVAPKIGAQLPDLAIADEHGNPVNIRELAREHYTVLVLGCLT